MIDDTSSLRLKLLRFPPIIGVVYIHAYFTAINFAHGTIGTEDLNALTDFVRVLVSQGIARVAVPLFFLMSGYLFFANFRWSQQTFLRKVTTRMRTLLIPFLFWNVAMLGFYATVQSIPALAPYFSGPTALIRELSLMEYPNVLLGFKGYPIAYHFWFIRDLMVLILLAPLIALVLRFAALPFLLAVYLCWVTGKWPVYIPDCAGVLFFSCGALCALRGRDLFCLDLSFIGWALLAVLTAGIGNLWLVPYMTVSRAAFYRSLPRSMGDRAPNGWQPNPGPQPGGDWYSQN